MVLLYNFDEIPLYSKFDTAACRFRGQGCMQLANHNCLGHDFFKPWYCCTISMKFLSTGFGHKLLVMIYIYQSAITLLYRWVMGRRFRSLSMVMVRGRMILTT
ncbi:hypothetical protein DCAR_0103403 [Daucus carota subsp. sativus]|uniref:Uncharacterized protein n=1 Tax=Daucus carota subsp. sativus TaxID=79200 RepID=A0AAF0W8N3_DAUCS|nr:PREDICTED: uncharacterized protein LOC108193473 [Daucus carota subsp. sativus]WOG84221.1 hypothetical protein DCAR_0103403 [Daucus carota subsp. sativus]